MLQTCGVAKDEPSGELNRVGVCRCRSLRFGAALRIGVKAHGTTVEDERFGVRFQCRPVFFEFLPPTEVGDVLGVVVVAIPVV